MPNITALIQQLAGGDYYAKVDWRKAYNQIRVKEGSEWKLAFQCHRGLFQPTVMPFGPKTAPSHMQRFVTWMCQDFLAEGWLINLLDDFIIKTTGTVADHITHITRYLTRLMQNHIYIKESKCQWFVKEVPFVGFLVNKYGYTKQPEKVEAIKKWGTPSNVKEVRAFTGLVNFYRAFATQLSTISKPLYDLTHKNTKFHWGPKEQEAFEKIKEILTADVFLMFPDHEKPFYLFFDSSDLGTGAVLQQEDEFNRLRPIEYYSYKWNKSEYNYSTPDKELYGLILALKHWYHLLFGSKHTIFVQTDHKSSSSIHLYVHI
ncbi:hypothetical protein SeLEV6574_g05670 [Synchytrium endobioticum]|uniref:Reverse transcriptase domain-containing protein n=1 Tax=Synchytrium endobioticum TaxID=286115 RepID=A0A507CT26_9FUNG|nr:hypothetical protein SeLEV6574_g05670 [Synchytrium endobioticum]